MIEINSYSKKGYGVGSTSKGNLAIKGALKQEIVEYQHLKRRQGKLLKVLKPSCYRTEPLCLHFLECGGCTWQEFDYAEQVQEKEKIIDELFKEFQIEQRKALIPADSLFHYRNKMEFSFSQDKAGHKYLGLILAGSKGRVFNVGTCFLASCWFSHTLARVREWWEESSLAAFHPFKNTGSLRTLALREGFYSQERMIILTVSGNPEYGLKKEDLKKFKELFQENESVFLRIQHAQKGSETSFSEMLLQGKDHINEKLVVSDQVFHCKISPTAFFQPNTRQAEKLYGAALELVKEKGLTLDRVFDLYSGTGTLGMLFSHLSEQVIAIELNPYAVLDGEENLKRNGIDNMMILKGDVEIILKEQPKEADLVIVDPPRAGLSVNTLKLLAEIKPQAILYISCNPHTQADNLKFFLEQGYFLTSLQPVDLFPHTIHIETIALLQKR